MGLTISKPTEAASSTTVPKPKVYSVLKPVAAILNFDPDSRTPESSAKKFLLSDQSGDNVITLFGMGGVGKTTRLQALAMDNDVRARFTDGIWMFEFGQDVSLVNVQHQLIAFANRVCEQPFASHFEMNIMNDNTRKQAVADLVEQLAAKRFLIILDNVWRVSGGVLQLYEIISTEIQNLPQSSLKLIVSTRSERIADESNPILVEPIHGRSKMAEKILSWYAGVENAMDTSSSDSHRAFSTILEKCAGLPLALAVAGRGVKSLMKYEKDGHKQNAWERYRQRIDNKLHLLVGESKHHPGLFPSLLSSLHVLEESWNFPSIDLKTVFRSLCILRKGVVMPARVLRRLWKVTEEVAEQIVDFLKDSSLVSVVVVHADNGEIYDGLRMHDLMHDASVHLAEEGDKIPQWHDILLQAYADTDRLTMETANGSHKTCRSWWNMRTDYDYIEENLVRHLLGAKRVAEALALLSDYRWIQRVNGNTKRIPFEKIMSDLRILAAYVREHEKSDMGQRLVDDIDTIVETMVLCMIPHCMNNRKECSFQLYGRLSSLRSTSNVIKRLLWSIECHASRPWVRAGPGILTSATSNLKRVLTTNIERVRYIEFGATSEEFYAGGTSEIRLVRCNDGSEKRALDRQFDELAAIDFDRASEELYSCTRDGRVNVWKNDIQVRSFQVMGLNDGESVTAMRLLQENIVLGSRYGRVLVFNASTGAKVLIKDWSTDKINTMTVGPKKQILVGGCRNGTIQLWDTRSWEEIFVFEGHKRSVREVALSPDENIIASVSNDRKVCLWNTEQKNEACAPILAHKHLGSSVAFSSDGQYLYSGGVHKIYIWDVRNLSRGVPLVHVFKDARMSYVATLRVSDDNSELFATSNHEKVFVWKARPRLQELDSRNPAQEAFLKRARVFGVTTDDTRMLVFDKYSRCGEIRSMCDVVNNTDRVIDRCTTPSPDRKIGRVAVSGEKFIAYVLPRDYCIVKVLDLKSKAVRYNLTGFKTWVRNEDMMPQLRFRPYVKALRFSADEETLTAMVVTAKSGSKELIIKFLSWDLNTGEELSENSAIAKSNASDIKQQVGIENSPRPILVCKGDDSKLDFSTCVEFNEGTVRFTAATLEHNPYDVWYSHNNGRMWVSKSLGGLEHIDLITNETVLNLGGEPPLPNLANASLLSSQNKDNLSTALDNMDQSYSIFISHAGPDKHTIAEILYSELTRLGLAVFLDKHELQPGQNAPKRMVHAMKTAKIAIIILSPEFAARYWTMKELFCFLERFQEAGVIIIPVFYRLTLDDCRNEDTLLKVAGENGENVFIAEGFMQRMAREPETTIKDVVQALQQLRGITGIENNEGAGNGEGTLEKEKRNRFCIRIVDAVVSAMRRLERHWSCSSSVSDMSISGYKFKGYH